MAGHDPTHLQSWHLNTHWVVHLGRVGSHWLQVSPEVKLVLPTLTSNPHHRHLNRLHIMADINSVRHKQGECLRIKNDGFMCVYVEDGCVCAHARQ